MLLSCTTLDREKEALINSNALERKERADYLSSFYTQAASPELSYNYAYYLLENGGADKALAVTENAIRRYPDLIRFSYMKAYILKSEYKLYSYEKGLLSILDKNKADIVAREALIDLYNQLYEKDKAINISLDTLSYSIDNKKAINTLARYIDFYRDKFGYKETENIKKEGMKQPSLRNVNITFEESLKAINDSDILSSLSSDK